MSKRKHKHHEEEHENHERWLVTYADMVTLLMVLFIVMFAMSQVDERKFAELREGLAAGFGSQPSILTGSSSILEQPGTAALSPVAPELQLANLSEEDKSLVEQALQESARLTAERAAGDAEAEAERFERLRKNVEYRCPVMTLFRAAGVEVQAEWIAVAG